MKISVIGTGYVGLVTGACLAEIGHEVVCTDNDKSKIDTLEAGGLPIYEPGLEKVIAKARKEKRIRFSANPADAIDGGEAIFICVGTPPLPNGDADLSAIDHVARVIATEAKSPKLVVEKSTVPARTGQELKRALSVYGRKTGVKFRVASNPEFLREGTAVGDFLHPDRIVVGVEDETAERQLREIYAPVLERKFNCPIHSGPCPAGPAPAWVVTTINSAELIKHASNSFLAMKISYANMVADLAERLGADIDEVVRAMGLDPRIGPSFLSAGLGFGGFCFPKDLQAFVHLAERSGVDFSMLKEAEKVNKRRIDRAFEKIREALWVVRGKRIGRSGACLQAQHGRYPLRSCDRSGESAAGRRSERPRVRSGGHGPGARRACLRSNTQNRPTMPRRMPKRSSIATEWDEFRKLDWERMREAMARPFVLDGRNLLSPREMKARGFEYRSLRPAPNRSS